MAFTYFFRDVQTLDLVCKVCLPYLKTRKYIKIWDAGCAMGHEPYTLAMMIKELTGCMYFRNIKIIATDIDGSNLFKQTIEMGQYPFSQIERIPQEFLSKYFIRANNDDYKISESIKKSILFYKHDLLSYKPIGKEFGLIICKNVLLHFSYAERIEVIKMFYESLSSGGYFVTEQTQKLPKECENMFEQITPNAQIYKKITSNLIGYKN